MGSKKALIVGWYNKGNLGDEAFKRSFQQLWPSVEFEFKDHFPLNLKDYYSFLWIGGGSFLDSPIKGIANAVASGLPIGFIGVGVGNYVHPDNLHAISIAKVMVLRDQKSFHNLSDLKIPKPPTFIAPDLVFAQKNDHPNVGHEKRVVVIGNDFLSPTYKTLEWQNLAFQWFCQEFAKIADQMIEKKVHVDFLPMCVNPEIDDRRFSSQIISRMKFRTLAKWETIALNEYQMREAVAHAELVITLRLHGAIFSLISETPFVLIGSHEKMNGLMQDVDAGAYLDYYGFTSRLFEEAILQPRVKHKSKFPEQARERWECIAGIVGRIFSL